MNLTVCSRRGSWITNFRCGNARLLRLTGRPPRATAVDRPLSGCSIRNAASQNGSAPPPYLLDQWGVVRSYVAAGSGVDLESIVGQQVSLHGTVRTLPGGDMPVMTCDKIAGGSGEQSAAPTAATSEEQHDEAAEYPGTPVAAATGWEAKPALCARRKGDRAGKPGRCQSARLFL